MKRIILILFFLGLATPCRAVTIGGPDMSIPEESVFLKQQAVNKELDRYEYNMNIKTSLDIEFLIDEKLNSAPADVANAKLEGQSFMIKFSNNFYNLFEPYIKIGTSNLEVKWDQNGKKVQVEADPGFVWGGGIKARIHEFKDYGVKLTLDAQYIKTDLDVDKAKIGGSTQAASASNEKFKKDEWHISLLASKKFVVPFGTNDLYMVPYAGVTYSWEDIDVAFTQSTTGRFYSVYDASPDNELGLVFGCDFMPFFLSYYLLNFELRLVNETAFTLGGTVKF